MLVLPVPVLSDNYAYVLVDEDSNESAVVDPVEPHKVLPVIGQKGINLNGILTTHHHHDHAGGNTKLLQEKPNVTVWGGDDRIPQLTHRVKDEEVFRIGRLEVTALYTVCHTRGSVSYYVVDPSTNDKAVFTGDTLFIGGCGRFFEGDAKQMYNSLHNVLGRLPKDTKVYCGHEYTKSNLRFAAHVEPKNAAVKDKLAWCETHACTVPSTIGDEFEYNPFMRLNSPEIRKAVGLDTQADPIEVLARLRAMKDNFR
ncbi:hydroxyacylglutathione hydrolase [Spizellomyces sp. 'palustris']|nr:hydroxyacylglutathione hydrolase [Spizellomyces sp. 'palustris']